MKAEVERRLQRDLAVDQARWEIKRAACLEALSAVDAVWSNQNWGGADVEKSAPPPIEDVRRLHNGLLLTCEQGAVPDLYLKCLGVRGPIGGDLIVDLRSAIRRELGFGDPLIGDRENAWIGRVLKPPAA